MTVRRQMIIGKRVNPSCELFIRDVKIKYVPKFNNFGNMCTINFTFVIVSTMIHLLCPPAFTRYIMSIWETYREAVLFCCTCLGISHLVILLLLSPYPMSSITLTGLEIEATIIMSPNLGINTLIHKNNLTP